MTSFTADENAGAEPRHAKILVSYPGARTAELSVTQEASSVRYDYDYQLSEFSGTLYKDEFSSGFNGEHNFNIFISDLPLVHDKYQSGGHYYNLDIFTDPSHGDALPAGTYVLGEAWETEPMTFTPEYSSYVFYGEDDWTQGYFKAGTIEVAVDGRPTASHLLCRPRRHGNLQARGKFCSRQAPRHRSVSGDGELRER